jgi:diguanylate cyclase (GGDEF)-like protein
MTVGPSARQDADRLSHAPSTDSNDGAEAQRRLAEHALNSVVRSMLPPAAASFLPLKLLTDTTPKLWQVAWAFASCFTALFAIFVSRSALRLGRHTYARLRIAMGPHIFVVPMIAIAFPQAPESARNLMLSGTLSIITIVLITLLAGDRNLSMGIAIWLSSPIVLYSTMLDLTLGWRILAGTLIVIAVATVVQAVHEPLRRSITLAIDNEHLVRDLQIANAELKQRVLIDPLTGVSNRLGLDAALTEKHERVGLLYVDIDHFKHINDTNGHAVGDTVLVALAATLSRSVRPGDVVSRLGGDEFVLLLPGAGAPETEDVARRVRAAVVANPQLAGVTVSIGGTTGDLSAESPDAVLHRADHQLYEAKRSGRDRAALAPRASVNSK